MKLNNLIEIKNYKGGKDGNLLVSFDENLVIDAADYTEKGKDIPVLLCTAYVSDEDKEALDLLEKHCDENTPCNKLIVVGKKFMKLPNKKKLALLEIQNAAASFFEEDNNLEARIYGEYMAIRKFGKICVRTATRKEQKFNQKNLYKAARGAHRNYKKEQKVLNKMNKAASALNKFAPNITKEAEVVTD